jgi:outer membrane protein assembly factor BamD (BamD/ComL family)
MQLIRFQHFGRWVCLALSFYIPNQDAAGARPYVEEARTPHRFRLLRPAERSPDLQLEHARDLRQDQKINRAARQYRALVRYWPHKPEAPAAQKEIGDLYLDQGKMTKAFDTYQVLFDSYAGLFPHEEVLEKQLSIATNLMDRRKGQFFIFPGFEAPERVLPMLEKILENGPRWERAPDAQWTIGRIYERTMQYEMAVFAYDRFLARYPRSERLADATAGKARALYQLAREAPNDADAAETAVVTLAMFIVDFPDHEEADTLRGYLSELQEQRARIAFNKADYYDRIARDPKAALTAYELFVEQFPTSTWTEQARERINELTSHMENGS